MAKRCPTCQSEHPDALDFCPADGAMLTAVSGAAAVAHLASDDAAAATKFYAAIPLQAVAAKVQQKTWRSTYAEVLQRAPLPAARVVPRLATLADAVHAQRKGRHGVLTPLHLRFASTDASGAVEVAAAADVTDPMTVAAYTAPELQDGGHAATPAAEVYALGCILFHALTGRPPYAGATAAATAQQHATAAVPAVRLVHRTSDVAPAVEVELQRAMRKRPGDRHADAAALAEALRRASDDDDRGTVMWSQEPAQPATGKDRGAHIPPPPPGPAETVSPPPPAAAPTAASAALPHGATADEAETTTPTARVDGDSGRQLRMGLAVAGLLALVAVVAVLWSMRSATPPQSQPQAEPPPPQPAAQADIMAADVAEPPPDTEDTQDAQDSLDADDTDSAEPDVPAAKSKTGAGRGKAGKPAAGKGGASDKKSDGPAVF